MNHVTEENLVEAYYGDADRATRAHLDDCAECRAAFSQLKETLDAASEYPVPARSPQYGAEVWARLQSRLPARKQRVRRWIWSPVLAAALAIAFVAGTWTEHRRVEKADTAATARARERVLLLAIGDHLERSQIMLTELAHADPQTADVAPQRQLAADLVEENRLLRERAARTGDMADASLLEDIQRVLLDLANGSDDLSTVQRRIEDQSLLFKVRVMSVDARRKGQNL
jgi:hypothetical protein